MVIGNKKIYPSYTLWVYFKLASYLIQSDLWSSHQLTPFHIPFRSTLNSPKEAQKKVKKNNIFNTKDSGPRLREDMDAERSELPVNYDMLSGTIRTIFTVTDERLREDGSIEFVVTETNSLKKDFETLIRRLKPHGYLALLRRDGSEIVLKVGKVEHKEKKTSTVPFVLFAATVATVSIDGYFRTTALPGYDPTVTVLLYIAGIMGIIGMHELSHKIAAAMHGMRASLPHFIPGIPSILPTFGAFISTRDPPVNRDSLFDLGLSGPLAGLAVTLLVGVGGALTAVSVPFKVAAIATGVSPMELILANKVLGIPIMAGTEIVTQIDMFTWTALSILHSLPENYVFILSPLTFAATLGFLITFLNLMPAWQLDGGHIAAAMLSRRQHKIATYLSIIVLFVLGFTIMALFVLVLSLQTPEARPLDDVSKLSIPRKLIFGGVAVLAVGLYFFTIVDNPFFVLGF
jgi:membrane-associated protease RseP (regulator of RpoE activity)